MIFLDDSTVFFFGKNPGSTVKDKIPDYDNAMTM